jgi:hypothetical protein
VKAGAALSFNLVYKGVFKDFHSSATSDLAKTSWLVDGVDAFGDEEDLGRLWKSHPIHGTMGCDRRKGLGSGAASSLVY